MAGPKILILSAYDVGGASIAAIRLHLGLLSIGLNSKLLTLHKSNSNIPEHFQFSPRSNWKKRIELKLRQRNEHNQRRSLNLSNNQSLSGEFSLPIASFDITDSPLWDWADIVNIHWVNEWITVEDVIRKSGNKPLVWTMHDMHIFTGGCHYSHHCYGFEFECKNCPLLEKSNMPQLANQFWKVKRNAFKMHNPKITITAPSNWMAGLAQKSSLLSKFEALGIPNSLDTKVFKPISKSAVRNVLNIPQEKMVLLTVIQSLEDRRKGFSYLIDALRLLENPEDYFLCTVGNMSGKESGYPINYLHLGTIVDERLMAIIYNASDILVHPAIEDNFPNVVIEALSCGIPVAGFKIGGMPEMIENGQNGYLSNEIEPEGLKDQILKSVALSQQKDKISEMAHSKYDLKVQAKNFQILFEKILA